MWTSDCCFSSQSFAPLALGRGLSSFGLGLGVMMPFVLISEITTIKVCPLFGVYLFLSWDLNIDQRLGRPSPWSTQCQSALVSSPPTSSYSRSPPSTSSSLLRDSLSSSLFSVHFCQNHLTFWWQINSLLLLLCCFSNKQSLKIENLCRKSSQF